MLRDAFAALEALAWPAARPCLPLGARTEPMRLANGLFDPAQQDFGVRVADDADYPGITLLHEIGHAVDYLLLGGGHYASEVRGTAAWEAWYEACLGSAAIAQVRAHLIAPAFTAEVGFAEYLLEFPEMFARSFAQCVACRSSSVPLQNELTAMAQSDPPQQWAPHDFVTLDAALMHLLSMAGGEP
ncbi:hypothetical protein [Deinococcus multiflagellatus]|uniref:Uncharacterized protein n=1 Tax=Deinococcus multiflagellatus TaxID=1656887 RepID=A0ABW1ZS87_9DEIO